MKWEGKGQRNVMMGLEWLIVIANYFCFMCDNAFWMLIVMKK